VDDDLRVAVEPCGQPIHELVGFVRVTLDELCDPFVDRPCAE
jgi:hypothetical protein